MTEFIIAKLGACSALGTEASGIQAELAAGTSAFEHRLGPRGPVTVAALEILPADYDQPARRRALLAHAVNDLLAGVTCAANRAAVVMASATNNEDDVALGETVFERLHVAGFNLVQIQTQSHGRASWFAALLLVRALLVDDAYDVVFVFASDSRCDGASIATLARGAELLGEDNRDGLVPGEGACVALCCRPDSPLASLPSAMCCEVAAIGREPHPFVGSEPNLSVGLTTVFRAVSTGASVDVVVDCQTGQTRFTKEFHAAYLRCGALMPEPLVRSSTAATFGEAGAATAGLAMVVAQLELSVRERALLYASDDEGRLGAAILGRVGGRTALRERLECRCSRPEDTTHSLFHSRAELIDDHLETCGYLQLDRLDDLDSAQTPWFELDGIEARLQSQLDALALGGSATIDCARIGLKSVSADRRQGSALVAGSWFAGSELVDDVVEIATTLDDFDLDELAGALTLASHAAPIVTAMIRHPSPRLRRVGLELAPACSDISTRDIAAGLFDPDMGIRSRAAICLARRGAHDHTDQLLAAAGADPECAGHLAALVWLGHERAIDRLRWLLWQAPEHAVASATWLAMCGEPHDLQAIHDRLTTLAPNAALVDALGIVGLPASAPYLLEALARGDEQLRVAAARALDRMTGAGLRDQRTDEHGIIETLRSLDAQRWGDWLDQGGELPAGRLRGGQAWSLRAVWDELCAGYSEHRRRRLAADELSLRAPVRVHLEVRSSTAAQRQVLAGWARVLGFGMPDSAMRGHNDDL